MTDPFARQLIAAIVAIAVLQLVMLLVTLGVRAPLLIKAGIKPDAKLTRRDLDRLPDWARTPGDNYNNLFEAPTAFFAISIVLVLMHGADAAHVICAWAYVALRCLHSLVHATFNAILPRSLLFGLSWVVLGVMIVRTALGLVG